MDNKLIKSVIEEKVQTTSQEDKNRVEIIFLDAQDNENTVVLQGSGSIKILTPVC